MLPKLWGNGIECWFEVTNLTPSSLNFGSLLLNFMCEVPKFGSVAELDELVMLKMLLRTQTVLPKLGLNGAGSSAISAQ